MIKKSINTKGLENNLQKTLIQGSKKFAQFSLKPKNPNLDNNTQREDQKIQAI